MFSVRQSSPDPTTSASDSAIPGGYATCGDFGPNSSASRTPPQGWTGCGARKWVAPNGGAANGTPLKEKTPSLERPRSFPKRVSTIGTTQTSVTHRSLPNTSRSPADPRGHRHLPQLPSPPRWRACERTPRRRPRNGSCAPDASALESSIAKGWTCAQVEDIES